MHSIFHDKSHWFRFVHLVKVQTEDVFNVCVSLLLTSAMPAVITMESIFPAILVNLALFHNLFFKSETYLFSFFPNKSI